MANPSEFIDPDYLPADISFKDPRSMKIESLIKFFKHVLEREQSHGIPNAFRFKAVLSSRKNGTICPAHYKHDGDGDDSENENVPPPRVRRKRRKAPLTSVNTAVLNPEILEEIRPGQTSATTVIQSSAIGGQTSATAQSSTTTGPTTGTSQTSATPEIQPTTTTGQTSATQEIRPTTTTGQTTAMAQKKSSAGTGSPGNIGLYTPEKTPASAETPSPPPRNRARNSKFLLPIAQELTPATASSATNSSSSQPRRSQRLSQSNTPVGLSTPPSTQSPQKKKKKGKK